MFHIDPTTWFASVPPELAVFFLSMLPIVELRAAIPVGLEVYGLPALQVWFIAVVGNLVPIAFLLLAIPHIHDWLLKQKFIGRAWKKKLEKVEKKFSGKYAKYGAAALVLFVAIPLPMTGAWTGTLVAFLFNFPFRRSFPLIAVGVCVAGTIMTLVTLFAGGVVRAIF